MKNIPEDRYEGYVYDSRRGEGERVTELEGGWSSPPSLLPFPACVGSGFNALHQDFFSIIFFITLP